MRRLPLFCVPLLLAATVALAEEPGYRVRVDLVDGSRVVGTPENTSLKVDIGFDELEVPLERIRRAAKTQKAGELRIELTNRDTITGRLVPEPLKVEAIFGQVVLEMKHVVAVEVVPTDQIGWLPTHRGLVAYYALDDGASATNHAADRHHGKVTGVEWVEKGRRGGAFDFDGRGRVTVDHHAELCPQKFTVALWIRPAGPSSSYQVVFAKTNPGSWNQGYGLVRVSGDADHLQFFVNYYGNSAVKVPVRPKEWTHLACTFDGAKLTAFVNGKPVDAKAVASAGGPMGQPIGHTTKPLVLGGDGSGYAWSGLLDEFVLFDRPLDTTEVRRLYESGGEVELAEPVESPTRPGAAPAPETAEPPSEGDSFAPPE